MKYFLYVLFFSFVTVLNAQIEITDDNAEAKLLVNDDRLIVVDFYATWCGPCKTMDPILKELVREYKGRVDFYKIDVDKNEVDDALGVTAMPTYFFLKNSTNLKAIEGARSKADMKALIEEYIDYEVDEEIVEVEETVVESTETEYYNASDNHGNTDEFSISNVADLWNDSSKLNSLAWHIYQYHEEQSILYKGVEIVKRSIELEETYYNADTIAALYYKLGDYKLALKKAKRAIQIAKRDNISYGSTTELMNDIIDEM
jgi:thioredoxin 1